jgi:NAD(P)-dependent dehydrogenase (short-subunit alcohol dehydrogenase family)
MYTYPKYDLKGKVAVVTGAGQGLGKWIALALADAGADVLVAALHSETAERTCAEIREMGRNSTFLAVDVADVEAVKAMMATAEADLGGLDILVNNAGVNIHKAAIDFTPEDFARIVDVNEKGVFFCSQAAAARMIPKGGGRIINISSVTAFMVRAGIPNSIYAMTKAGVVMLTKALAEEWARFNINVNAIAPGYFYTPFVEDRFKDREMYNTIISTTPLGRAGNPEDIMGVTVFLASAASAYITGQTICIDGGRTIL